jgi:hypothetical protein
MRSEEPGQAERGHGDDPQALSLIATSFQPKKQAIAETITNGNCKPGHCRPKTSGGRQVVAEKTQ